MEAGQTCWTLAGDVLIPICFSFDTGCWGHLGSGGPWTRPWPSRMPPCPPQQSRNGVTQLPTPELGEMELTWQEIMSITELQVSRVRRAGERKSREAGNLAGTEAGAWSKQGSWSQAGNVPGTGKGRAGVRREIWVEDQNIKGRGCGRAGDRSCGEGKI